MRAQFPPRGKRHEEASVYRAPERDGAIGHREHVVPERVRRAEALHRRGVSLQAGARGLPRLLLRRQCKIRGRIRGGARRIAGLKGRVGLPSSLRREIGGGREPEGSGSGQCQNVENSSHGPRAIMGH